MHSNEPCGYTSDWGVKAGSKVGALLCTLDSLFDGACEELTNE